MSALIQWRRGTAASWVSANPVLAEAEPGVETDTGKFKIGNGVTAWNSLGYGGFNTTVNGVTMNSAAVPSAPAAGKLELFAGPIAGRQFLKMIGPSGIDTAFQPFLARNKVGYWCPPGNATTVPGVLGYTAPTAVGTVTARTVALTNVLTRMRRLGYVSAAGAGSLASHYQAVQQISFGDGGIGGFFKCTRFGISDAATVAGARMWLGVAVLATAPTNVEPATLVSQVGVGHGAADTNLKVYYGGTTAQTPIDLGANFPITAGSVEAYELALFSPPDGGCYYEVTRLSTGHVATGFLPADGTGVTMVGPGLLVSYHRAFRTNNATALAVGLDICSDYIETDY